MTQTAADESPRQGRLVPGTLSTVLAKPGQWIWTKLVSPLLNAMQQAVKKWFSDRLRPAKAPDSTTGAARDPIAEGLADLPRSELAPEVGPCPTSPTKATLGTSSVPGVASVPLTPAIPAADRDPATQWNSIGADLSDRLGSLRDVPDLDAKAVSYVKGLQRLLPMMEWAEPQIRSLAAGFTRAAPPRDAVRQVLLQFVLPVMDNLYRCQQALESEKNRTPMLGRFHTLCSQIYGRFQTLLSAWDVRETAPLDQPFDPREQEAVVQMNAPGAARGQVQAVYLPGFWLGSQLLRPAQVGVVC